MVENHVSDPALFGEGGDRADDPGANLRVFPYPVPFPPAQSALLLQDGVGNPDLTDVMQVPGEMDVRHHVF